MTPVELQKSVVEKIDCFEATQTGGSLQQEQPIHHGKPTLEAAMDSNKNTQQGKQQPGSPVIFS